MKNYFMITNEFKDNGLKFTNQIKDYLNSIGMVCTGFVSINQNQDEKYSRNDPSLVAPDTEFIIILGGDGTFIHVGMDLHDLEIPIIGFNLGQLGFLTEITLDDYKELFLQILNDDVHIENRMVLDVSIIRDEKVMFNAHAFNDFVLAKTKSKGIIEFDLNVNGQFLNSYSSDGIVISTPTGSTGYNLSAGGPVVYPTAEIVLATPICAHTLNSRTIVFSANEVIELVCKNKISKEDCEMVVSFDGDNDFLLNHGDIIRCTKSKATVKILSLNNLSFVEHLGRNMR